MTDDLRHFSDDEDAFALFDRDECVVIFCAALILALVIA